MSQISTVLEITQLTVNMRNRLVEGTFAEVNEYVLQQLREKHPGYGIQTIAISTPENTVRIYINFAVTSTEQYPMNTFKEDLQTMD